MHALPIDPTRFRALIVAAILALAAAVLVASAESADAAGRKGPAGGAFYKGPKQTPKGHGKLIWQRNATKLTPIAGARLNKTILYTSRSPAGDRIVVSGSVSVPKGKAPKGGWPVISWAHGTTGAADACAPTRIRPNSVMAPYVAYVHPQMEDWVRAGYAVVATDYQGLGTPGPHPYLVGEAEGRSVVDIVSAARQLVPSLGKRFLIAGHSQGGQSSLFAASLADEWAPKLKLRGTVAYAPASHLSEQAKFLPSLTTPSGLSALVTLIFKGASTASDDLKPGKFLTAEAKALYPQTEQLCLAQLAESDSLGGLAPADLLRGSADLDPLYSVLDDMNPAVEIGPPVLLAQGGADTTVFPTFTDMLNGELDKLGDEVTYKTYPGVNHGAIVAAAEANALSFFEKRLPPK
ncbi:MAG TPA: alpha/beta fold hydrolase [Solirubrobacterales bacterium]|nr:alpha/beta fold hydrolase [Solirubrobacterales bacterium]